MAVRLRQAGIDTEFDLSAPSRGVGSHLKRASKLGARLTIIVGEDENKAGEATLKDMQGGEQRRVKTADVLAEVRKSLG
jgi:histidyl-tRNA synthetase